MVVIARSDSVGLAKQSVVGTKVTTMEHYLPVESAEVGLNREIQEVEESVGHRFPTDLDYGTEYWEANLKGKARQNSFGRLLSGFFGAPTTAATAETTAKSHTFTGAALPLVHSMLVSRVDPATDIVDLIYDAYGNELTISASVNEFVSFDASYIGIQNDATQTAPSVTLDSSPRVNFDEITAFASVNGAAEAPLVISDFEMKYSNNFETTNYVLGQRKLYTLLEGNADCEVKFTTKSALDVHYRRALAADPDNVKIRILGTGIVIGTAVPYTFELTVYKCQYLEAPAAISAADRLSGVEVTARAAYDATNSKFVDIKLINKTTAY